MRKRYSRRKDDVASKHVNRDMNPEVYALRRKVIDIIYDVKRLVPDLPRIDVRITDAKDRAVLASARMGDNIVWVPASTVERPSILVQVVLHEILHAVYAVEHVKSCPLMGPYLVKISDEEAMKLFLRYAENA